MVGHFDESHASRTQAQRNVYIRYENLVHPERFICVILISIYLLTLVSFLEVPLWCLRNRGGWWAWQRGRDVCLAPGAVYLSGADYLPTGATVLVEVGCLGYLALLLIMEVTFQGYFSSKRLQLRAVCTGLYAADAVLFGLLLHAGKSPSFRIAPYCRIGLLVVNVNAIYFCFEAACALTEAFLNVLLLLLCLICFGGWLGAVTLDDFRFENRSGVMVNEGFSTFRDGLYSMFMMTTVATFPDSLLPAYSARRIFGLFGVAYMLVAVFIFTNLILAVVYNSYSDFVKTRVHRTYTNRSKGLSAAFRLIAEPVGNGDGQAVVTETSFSGLVRHTNLVERVPKVSPTTIRFFFSLMDDDRSGAIDAAEFYDVCDILQYSFRRVSTRTWIQRRCPAAARSRTYSNLVSMVAAPAFERAITFALVLSSFFVFLQSWMDLANVENPQSERAWGALELAFSCFYIGALAVELTVKPFDEFWLTPSNRFDLVVSVTLFIAAVLWALPGVALDRRVVHSLTILRLLRLLNLVAAVPRFKLIATCKHPRPARGAPETGDDTCKGIGRIVPASLGVVGLLYASAALWVSTGVQSFGGLIYDGNEALDGSDYLESHYEVLNFNDFAMGFMPLFASLINGGPLKALVEAFDRVSQDKAAGMLFFFSWQIVGVLVMANIFSAFVIEAFLSQFNDAIALRSDAETALPSDRHNANVASLGYRIVPQRGSSRDDVYKAMYAGDVRDEDTG
ncbi:hypothetical protein M885DRAFT_450891 [Pelagophyceae sp. CCMP2097]|nr:hypothetical protein M885DRAFT_450891 [Pelagophyceae sp. CCMP2097]